MHPQNPKLSFDAMTIVGDLNISLLFFLGFELQIWRTKRGATTTPLLSAECQIEKKLPFVLTLPTV